MNSKRNAQILSQLMCISILAAGILTGAPINRATAAAASVAVATPAGVMYDRVTINYTIQNTPAASFDIKVEYSTSGVAGPYAVATEAIGSPSEGTTGMAAGEAGTSHVFVWNSFYDLNRAGIYNADAIVRVSAIDRMTGAPMGSAQTASFKVDNSVVAVALGQAGAGIPSVGDGGPATDALTFGLRQLNLAKDGSILLAELTARVRQFTVGGNIETVAGNGIPANVDPTTPFPANDSTLRNPRGVCMDWNGVVFVVDNGRSTFLATNPVTGSIVVVAGGGTGPDGPALNASLTGMAACISLPPVPGKPQVVLVTGQNRVRRFQYAYDPTTGDIDPASATIDTICGTASAGFSPDGTPAKSAQLTGPIGLAYDPSSMKLFVADTRNNVIRAIDLPNPNGDPGTINTVAGNGTAGFSGDGGPATAAQLATPSSVGLNPATGMMYIADTANNRIRQFTIGGMINTVAGNGGVGEAGIGGPALQANVSAPGEGLIVTRDGSVLISVVGTNQVLALTPDGNLTAVAGVPPSSLPGTGGQANQSPGIMPYQCAVSGDFLYVSDVTAKLIRKVDLSTGIVTRFAGNGVSGGVITDGMSALDAPLNPFGVTADSAGNVYTSLRLANRVYKIDSLGKITRFAGTGVSGTTGDNGPALQATLQAPNWLQFSNGSGALYIAGGNRIRRVDRNGIITTVGGGGTSTAEGVPATQASFTVGAGDNGMAIDPGTETIYVASGADHRVLKFPVGGNVTVLAGVFNTTGFTPDGALARGALLGRPHGIGVDARGNVFFSEGRNLLMRWIDTNGILRTVAGTGQAGLITEGSDPTRCSFFFSTGLMALDGQGNIYFPDLFYVVCFRPRY
ncbi:MAG: hypothetical protein HY650_02055 [Acidobacteria bacterium]|nr:hypothetical protein [Acidobacteriota bacterium]